MPLFISVCIVGLAVLLMCTPSIRDPVAAATARLLAAIERRPARAAAIAALCWGAWIGYTLYRDGRSPVPHWHDEHAYLLQARMIASGHFWLPSPAEPDFFDTFHVLVRPVYATKYPPGTALAHVPAMWLGLHWLTTSFALAMLSFATIAYVGIRHVGGWALPVLCTAAFTSGQYITVSVQALSQPVLLLLASIVWLAHLLDRDRPRLMWFAVAGFVGGWAAITRPADAVLLAAPPILLMLHRAWRRGGARPALAGTALGLLAASPFVALMLYVNHGITGSAFDTPWHLYADQYQPGEHIGFGDPQFGFLRAGLPQQKYDFYHQFVAYALSVHSLSDAVETWLGGARWTMLTSVVAAPPLLVALIPLAVYGLCRRRMQAPLASVVLMLGLYSAYPFLGAAYFFPIAPILWIGAACGIARLIARFPTRAPTLGGFVMMVLALVLASSQQPARINDGSRTTHLPFIDAPYFERKMIREIRTPAIVFFQYGPPASLHDERVYNWETARPEDGKIVRVHWLGGRNADVLRSLRPSRPTSRVYVYDRRTGWLRDVGTIDQALALSPDLAPSTRSSTAPTTLPTKP